MVKLLAYLCLIRLYTYLQRGLNTLVRRRLQNVVQHFCHFLFLESGQYLYSENHFLERHSLYLRHGVPPHVVGVAEVCVEVEAEALHHSARPPLPLQRVSLGHPDCVQRLHILAGIKPAVTNVEVRNNILLGLCLCYYLFVYKK